MSGPRKSVLPMALLALAALAFTALGVWQLERRIEKLALIAAVDQRVHAPAVAAPGPAGWASVEFASHGYRHIRASGVYLHDRETLVRTATALGPGFWVITPLRTDAGWTVLVNRGFVPADNRERAMRRADEPRGRRTVTGLLRTTEPGGSLLRSNDPSRDRWYSRDVLAIGRARQLEALAPYFIDAGPGRAVASQPIGGLTIVSFPNNHLAYALTWFALAGLALFGAVRLGRSRAGGS